MKTSKPAAGSGKAPATKKASGKKTKGKTAPTEDEIRKKAEEIYIMRTAKGENGDALQDWIDAEKMLKETE